MLGFVNNKLTSKADSTRARASMFRAKWLARHIRYNMKERVSILEILRAAGTSVDAMDVVSIFDSETATPYERLFEKAIILAARWPWNPTSPSQQSRFQMRTVVRVTKISRCDSDRQQFLSRYCQQLPQQVFGPPFLLNSKGFEI